MTVADEPEGVCVLDGSFLRKCVRVNQLCHRLQTGETSLFTRRRTNVRCDINVCYVVNDWDDG